ncbi:hypothetical protein BCON_0240g00050 [Botryotinia convoluta]|uniref:Fungal N-terminal domain-containing protein n=1 Tax=Botryotinia convoluta TaxID=54673 RepID=A0A4Z1HHA7_9HELO|nr:hypothetical protein BCON_0240g00050 [Botryotinia convoluta]
MAEDRGTIASGISIAQLAGSPAPSNIKLKNYWDQIYDAPEDIAFLVSEIEGHHAILRSTLEKQAQLKASCQPTGGLFGQSIKLCQDASSELDGLVNAPTRDINSNRKWKRTLGSANVFLKTDQLKKLKQRMKNATRFMHLAISWQMIFTTAIFNSHLKCTSVTRSFLTTLAESYLKLRISQSTCSTQLSMDSADLPQTTSITMEAKTRLPVDHGFYKQEPIRTVSQYDLSSLITFIFGSIGSQKVIKKNHKGAYQKYKAVYHPPAWIYNRAWQCMYIKDLSSLRWNIDVQICRTLDGNTAFYDCVVSGDLLNVQKMLRADSTRFIWPEVTQDWVGATPLHMFRNSRTENASATPLQYLISSPNSNVRNDTWKKLLETLHILVEGGAEE